MKLLVAYGASIQLRDRMSVTESISMHCIYCRAGRAGDVCEATQTECLVFSLLDLS